MINLACHAYVMPKFEIHGNVLLSFLTLFAFMVLAFVIILRKTCGSRLEFAPNIVKHIYMLMR
jgi:hypothetical protein